MPSPSRHSSVRMKPGAGGEQPRPVAVRPISATKPLLLSPPEPRTATAGRGSREGPRAFERLIGFDHLAELRLVAAVAAVSVRMIAADQFRIAAAEPVQIGVILEVKLGKRVTLLGGETVGRLPPRLAADSARRWRRADRRSRATPGRCRFPHEQRPASPGPTRRSATGRPRSLPGSSLQRSYSWRCARGHGPGTASASCPDRRNRRAVNGARNSPGSRQPGYRTAGLRALHPSMPFGLPCRRHLFLALQTPLYRGDAPTPPPDPSPGK